MQFLKKKKLFTSCNVVSPIMHAYIKAEHQCSCCESVFHKVNCTIAFPNGRKVGSANLVSNCLHIKVPNCSTLKEAFFAFPSSFKSS